MCLFFPQFSQTGSTQRTTAGRTPTLILDGKAHKILGKLYVTVSFLNRTSDNTKGYSTARTGSAAGDGETFKRSNRVTVTSSTLLSSPYTQKWPVSTLTCPQPATLSLPRPLAPPCGSGSCTRPRRRDPLSSYVIYPSYSLVTGPEVMSFRNLLERWWDEDGTRNRTNIGHLYQR